MSDLRNDTDMASMLKGETNDCAVRALAIASGTDYDTVHAMLKAEGRKHGKGTPWQALWTVAHSLGMKCYDVTRQRRQWGTVRNIAGKLRGNRTYLVYTRAHILPVVNGKVEDWTEGRLQRVVKVWQVDKA